MKKFDSETILSIIIKLSWSDFTNSDWEAFSGCNSKSPKIAYDEDGTTYIIDEDKLCIIPAGDDGTEFQFEIYGKF